MKEEKNKKVVNSKPKSSTSKRTTTAKKSTTVKKEVKKSVAAKKTTAKISTPKKSVSSKKTTPTKVVKKTAPAVKKTEKVSVKTTAKKEVKTPAKKTVKKVAPKVVAKPKTAPKKVEAKKVETKVEVKKVNTKKPVAKSTPVKKINKVESVSVNNANINKQGVIENNSFDYKKYLYFSALVLLSFILIIGIWDIASFYSYNKLNTSYLVSTGSINSRNQLKLEDANKTLSKINGDYFIYISYTNDKSIYNFEKKMKNVIKKYNLENKFYYINVNNMKYNADIIDRVNIYLGLRDAKVSKIPTIIYVNKDNEVLYNNIITTNNKQNISIGDFQKLLDTNGFTAK